MNTFAKLWPNTLSPAEPLRDLGYAPSVGFRELVFKVPWRLGIGEIGEIGEILVKGFFLG